MIDLKELEELDRKRKMLRAIVLKDPKFGFDKGLTYMTKVFENTVSAQVYGIRYQNYLIEMLKAKIINQKENCGDCSLNGCNIEIKASILNDTNRKLNLLQLRTYQNVHFYLFLACDSVYDKEYIYILNKDELSREFKTMNAVQTHGTKDANKDNVNVSFSLKLNFSKENDHLKRWNELYRVSNINEAIDKINGAYEDGKNSKKHLDYNKYLDEIIKADIYEEIEYVHYANNEHYIIVDVARIQEHDKWVNAVIYKSVNGSDKFVRTAEEFFKKFKQVDQNLN